MKNKKQKNLIKQIEFDEKTSEPIIVEVPEEEYLAKNKETSKIDEKSDFVKMKSSKETRKQMTVEKVLGYKKDEGVNKKQKTIKLIVTIVFIVFVAGVLAFTAYKDFFASGKEFPSWEEIHGIFANGWYFLIFALLSLGLAYFFKGMNLSVMCKYMTGKFHVRTCMETGVIGTYYNNVTPLAVGGQPFEIYHLSKHGIHGGVAASMPIATFFINQLAFATLGMVSLILFNSNALNIPGHIVAVFPPVYNVLAVVGLICCIFMPFLVVLFSMLPKVGAKLVHFVIGLGAKMHLVKNPKQTTAKTIKTVVHNSHCLRKIATNPLVFFGMYFISVLENLSSISIAYFSLKAFGYHIEGVSGVMEWLQVAQIAFILFASVTFIPTPGNSGAADLSFYLLFEVGLFAGLAFPAMITWRIISFYSTIIIGFVFATLKKKSDARKAVRLTPLESVAIENAPKDNGGQSK